VVLLRIVPQMKEMFFASVSQRTEQSSGRQVFVFVHGYNVAFEDAARRTAQIAYDLAFSGVPILYSWPSGGQPHRYPVDEANVEWSIQHFKDFLKMLPNYRGRKLCISSRSAVLLAPWTPGQYAEARVIACYTLRRGFHSGFKVFVGRIDEKPFSQHLMRHQRGEFGLNGGVMLVVGT
jgi:hypothetical protein